MGGEGGGVGLVVGRSRACREPRAACRVPHISYPVTQQEAACLLLRAQAPHAQPPLPSPALTQTRAPEPGPLSPSPSLRPFTCHPSSPLTPHSHPNFKHQP